MIINYNEFRFRRMKKLTPIYRILPELILVLVVISYWRDTGLRNPVAPVLMGLLLFQLILRIKTSGLIVSCLFLVLSLWMVLAFLSDAVLIDEMTEKTKTFLVYGICMVTVLCAASTCMFVKYVNKKVAIGRQTS